MHCAGEALARAEHMARSVGQVRFWTPQAVRLLLSLMQVYSALLERHGASTKAKTSSSSSPAAAESSPSDPAAAAAAATDGSSESTPGTPHTDRGPEASTSTSPSAPVSNPHSALTRTLLKLLVRPDLLGLLIEALELVHSGPGTEFSSRCKPHEAVALSVGLWSCMRDLVQFAGAHAARQQQPGQEGGGSSARHKEEAARQLAQLSGCLQQLSALLAPPLGLVPRLLQQRLGPDTLAVQLHVLKLLQPLFDAPAPMLLQLLPDTGSTPDPPTSLPGNAPPPGAAAALYVSHLHRMAAQLYYASNGDPESACAELCMLHVRLLLSLMRSGLPSVLQAALQASINDLLLSELALEMDFSTAAPQAEEEAAEGAGALTGDSGSDASGVDSSDGGGDSGSCVVGSLPPASGSGLRQGSVANPGRIAEEPESEEQPGGLKRAAAAAAAVAETAAAAAAVAETAAAAAAAAAAKVPGLAAVSWGSTKEWREEEARGSSGSKFEFCYDLNEDLERMMALEEKLGECPILRGG
jgi:hypothetical protein